MAKKGKDNGKGKGRGQARSRRASVKFQNVNEIMNQGQAGRMLLHANERGRSHGLLHVRVCSTTRQQNDSRTHSVVAAETVFKRDMAGEVVIVLFPQARSSFRRLEPDYVDDTLKVNLTFSFVRTSADLAAVRGLVSGRSTLHHWLGVLCRLLFSPFLWPLFLPLRVSLFLLPWSCLDVLTVQKNPAVRKHSARQTDQKIHAAGLSPGGRIKKSTPRVYACKRNEDTHTHCCMLVLASKLEGRKKSTGSVYGLSKGRPHDAYTTSHLR